MTLSARPELAADEPIDDFNSECGLSPDVCTAIVVDSAPQATQDPALNMTHMADATRMEVQSRSAGSQDFSIYGSTDTALSSGNLNWSKFGTSVSPERANALDVTMTEPGGARQTFRAETANGNLTLTQFERRVPVAGGREQVLSYDRGVLQLDGETITDPARKAQAMEVINRTVAMLATGTGRNIQVTETSGDTTNGAPLSVDGAPLSWRDGEQLVMLTSTNTTADRLTDPYAFYGGIPPTRTAAELQAAARGGDAQAIAALQNRAGTTGAAAGDAVRALVTLARGDEGTPANIRDAAQASLLNLAQTKPEARSAIFGALVGQLGQPAVSPETRVQLLKTLTATGSFIDREAVTKVLTDSQSWLYGPGAASGADATRVRQAYGDFIAKVATDGNPEAKAALRQHLSTPQSGLTWGALRDNPAALNNVLQSFLGSREAITPFMAAQMLDLARRPGGDGTTQRLSRTLLLSALGTDSATTGGAGAMSPELRQAVREHLRSFATANPANLGELATNAMRHGASAVDGLISLTAANPAVGNQIVDALLGARASANPPMAAAELAQRFQRVDGARQHLEELARGTGPLKQQATEILAAMNNAPRPGEPGVTERRDASGNLVRETRDAQGRLQRAVTYDSNNPPRPVSADEYNSRGQKIAQHTYRYNADGTGAVEGTTPDGKKLYTGTLDRNGKYVQMTHFKPDGRTVDYTDNYNRDANGRTTTVDRQNANGTRDTFTYAYDANGRVTSMTSQNQDGTREVHHYGPNGRETKVEQIKNGQHVEWNFNENGQITSVITRHPGPGGQPGRIQKDTYDPATGQVRGSQWVDERGNPLPNQNPPPQANRATYGYRTSFDDDKVERALFEGGQVPENALARPPRLDRPTDATAQAPPPVPPGAVPARLKEVRGPNNRLLARVQRNATNANRPDFIQFTDGARKGQVWQFQLDAAGDTNAVAIRNPANESQTNLVARGPDGNWQPPSFRFPGLNEPLTKDSKITPNLDGTIGLRHGGRNYVLGLDGVLRPAS